MPVFETVVIIVLALIFIAPGNLYRLIDALRGRTGGRPW